jgi:CRISPR-associated protein Csy3
MAKNVNIATVLAFEKKIVPSDGFFYGTSWEKRNIEETPLFKTLTETSTFSAPTRLRHKKRAFAILIA